MTPQCKEAQQRFRRAEKSGIELADSTWLRLLESVAQCCPGKDEAQ